MLRWCAAGVTAIGLLTMGPAQAQDVFRQTVVVTAAATPVELGSVTRTMTVITREQIARCRCTRSPTCCGSLSSVDVRARGERGVQTDFAVRGANFGQMLVLVDGVRLNDAQSGHHNGDIPVPLDAVERIEVLHGPGSSLFGADAFGGTVNVITRRDVTPRRRCACRAAASAWRPASGQAGFDARRRPPDRCRVADRSSGFMYDRDFTTATAHADGRRLATRVGPVGVVPAQGVRRQQLLRRERAVARVDEPDAGRRRSSVRRRRGGWTFGAAGSYRTHGDRFVFDQERPALSDNRHRTHAVLGAVHGVAPRRGCGGTVTAGRRGRRRLDPLDAISATTRSARASALRRMAADARQPRAGGRDAARRPLLASSARRGTRPPASAGGRRRRVRLRASVGRAFRVPTFTERYYRDPGQPRARPEVGPETAVGRRRRRRRLFRRRLDAAARRCSAAPTTTSSTGSGRRRPTSGAPTTCATSTTRGVELGVRKSFADGAFVAGATTPASTLVRRRSTQLSKYVLDYAPHSFTAAACPCRCRPACSWRRASSTGSARRSVGRQRLRAARRAHRPPLRRPARAVRRRDEPVRCRLSGGRRRRDARRGDERLADDLADRDRTGMSGPVRRTGWYGPARPQ